jgi:hypothetical protein
MTEEPQSPASETFVTWKDFSKVCSNLTERISKLEGTVKYIVWVTNFNLIANLTIIGLLLRFLKVI